MIHENGRPAVEVRAGLPGSSHATPMNGSPMTTDQNTAAEADADTVANRAAQVITRMGADIRALTGERDRYRTAWRSARERAQAYGEGILRVVKDREQYQQWLKQAEERGVALERAMESTAADALKHRGCHRDLMAQCLRAERAEAEAAELRRAAAAVPVPPPADQTAEDRPNLSPDPDRGGVILHLPEITYLDTQVWAVDVGLTHEALRDLRAVLAVLPEQTDRAAVLLRAHAALAEQAGRDQRALARIRQMADAWEERLPEVIRTPAVVSAIRAALEPADGPSRVAAEEQPTETPMFGSPDCTCIPFTRRDGKSRYCGPTDTVDMISGWEIGRDCPHHKPAVGEQPETQEARCPAKHGALGRICELPPGHSGMHTGSGPNGGAVWQGDAP